MGPDGAIPFLSYIGLLIFREENTRLLGIFASPSFLSLDTQDTIDSGKILIMQTFQELPKESKRMIISLSL